MRIVVCGAGEIGMHAARALSGQGHSVTVVDLSKDRLNVIRDNLDAATLQGDSAHASVLSRAGAAGADLVLATTSRDEVNLLAAAISSSLGAKRCLARVHDSEHIDQKLIDYNERFGIDRLVCPEQLTAVAIARNLRNPGAMAIEMFARGQIEIHQFPVRDDAPAINHKLRELRLPTHTRLIAISRDHAVLLPQADTVIEPGDAVVLAGNADVFDRARRLFDDRPPARSRLVIMGSSPIAIWLCRSIRGSQFTVRLFEPDPDRAEQLAGDLDWVTVIKSDPTDPDVFAEENIAQTDVFVALSGDDDHNILGAAWAKSMGVPRTAAVVQRSAYLHLLKHVGIDMAYSPRMVAYREIESLIDDDPVRRVASLAEGVLDVYRVRVGASKGVVGLKLREVTVLPDWIAAAIHRGSDVWAPSAEDVITPGDELLIVGPYGMESRLRECFRG